MKKLLVGFIMDGKSGGIDKYLLNFLTKVSNEEVRIDFRNRRRITDRIKKIPFKFICHCQFETSGVSISASV